MMADDAAPEELWQRCAEESPHTLMTRSKGSSSLLPRTTKTSFGKSWSGVFDSKSTELLALLQRRNFRRASNFAAPGMRPVYPGADIAVNERRPLIQLCESLSDR